MFYRVFFADGTTLDLKTLVNDSEGRPIRGLTFDDHPVILEHYTTVRRVLMELVFKKIDEDLFSLVHYDGLFEDIEWLLDGKEMQDLARQLKELGF